MFVESRVMDALLEGVWESVGETLDVVQGLADPEPESDTNGDGLADADTQPVGELVELDVGVAGFVEGTAL